ncbi:MAG TPA: T9SS type A sorting domain-containing protein, partial [Candidatus Cloacimonadota bacterium]|nr:T9SS type A sorting domain-containing protein [Candidatus Cloacimonadota bacterium]
IGREVITEEVEDVEKQVWSGSLDWAEVSYPVTAGTHTYKWAYVKDGSVLGGEDCTWVDKIVFPSAGNANPLNAPLAYINTESLYFTTQPETRILKLVNFGNQPLTGQITVPNGFFLNTQGTSSLNYNIPAYSHQDFNLIFNPTAPVSYNGQITINTNDTLHPQFVINIIAGINGTHFNPVWTGNAIQPMTIALSGTAINSLPLQIADEIAVFDGQYCVGALQILNTNPAGYSIVTSLDNSATPAIDGFTVGNSLQFKLWDAISQTEYAGYEIYADYIAGDSTFTANGSASYHLQAYPVITQNIPLAEGWNIVSFNVVSNQPNVASVFSPLVNDNQLVKVQNESGLAFEYLSTLNQWINQINEVQSTEGYYVKVNNNTNLSSTGYHTPTPLTIPLSEGWNLIAYPYLNQQQAMPLLETLISNNSLVKIMNESGQAIEHLPIIGWVNELQHFNAGKGYAIKVAQNTNLVYPAESTTANIMVSQLKDNPIQRKQANHKEIAAKNPHFQKAWSGNGYKHFNLYVLADDYLNAQLSAGDEIAVYDEDVCVGTHAVSETDSYFSIICSMKDNDETVNGYTPGNQYSLRIFKNQTEYDTIEYVKISGDDFYSAGGTTLLRVSNMLSADDLSLPKVTAIQSIYPNPFNPETTVQYSLHKADRVEIEIYNIKGQKVKTLINEQQNAGHYQVSWQGKDSNGKSVASGMYFCRLKTTSKTLTRKMMLIK